MYNPHTWLGLNLTRDKDSKLFMQQLVDTLSRVVLVSGAALPGPPGAGGDTMFKSTYDTNYNGVVDTCDSLAFAKLTGVPGQLSINNLAVTANQSVDCTGYARVWINYTLTGAIAFTTTLNNLASGTQVLWRVLNSSGATQTLTLAANSPAANAYSVVSSVWAGTATWSGGVAVNNNAHASILGIAANVGANWMLYGMGANG